MCGIYNILKKKNSKHWARIDILWKKRTSWDWIVDEILLIRQENLGKYGEREAET